MSAGLCPAGPPASALSPPLLHRSLLELRSELWRCVCMREPILACAGAAFVIRHAMPPWPAFRIRVREAQTSYKAELVAIVVALTWAASAPVLPLVIHTDSHMFGWHCCCAAGHGL